MGTFFFCHVHIGLVTFLVIPYALNEEVFIFSLAACGGKREYEKKVFGDTPNPGREDPAPLLKTWTILMERRLTCQVILY